MTAFIQKVALLFVALLSIAGSAGAQTVTATNTQPAPCFYCPGWVTITGNARLVSGTLGVQSSSFTPNFVTPAIPIPSLVDSTSSVLNTVFDLTFPAPSASSTVVVSGIYLTLQPSGGGIVFGPVVEIYPLAIAVSPGNTVSVHYESPVPPGSPFVTVSAISPPLPPPPPPPPTRSPSGTAIGSPQRAIADGFTGALSSQILDGQQATWTVIAIAGSDACANQVGIARNGARQWGSVDYAVIDRAGAVWVLDACSGSPNGWQMWNGTGWTFKGATGPTF